MISQTEVQFFVLPIGDIYSYQSKGLQQDIKDVLQNNISLCLFELI